MRFPNTIKPSDQQCSVYVCEFGVAVEKTDPILSWCLFRYSVRMVKWSRITNYTPIYLLVLGFVKLKMLESELFSKTG